MFPMMDDESDVSDVAPAQARRKQKGVSGRLCTANTTVMLQVTWPHKVIDTPLGLLTIYDELDSMTFINCALKVMAREPEKIKARMLTHLQKLVAYGEHYGWLIIKFYHTAWLQHLKHGRAMGDNELTKLKL